MLDRNVINCVNEMSFPGLHNCTNDDSIVFVLKYRVLQFVFAISTRTSIMVLVMGLFLILLHNSCICCKPISLMFCFLIKP